MHQEIGNRSVVEALSQTLGELNTFELRGTQPPIIAEPGEGRDATTVRFVERSEIGRGGLGVVVEAFDQDLRRTVAIKRALGDSIDPRRASALVKEAQITAQLEHPNVPSVHALGLDSIGRPYFVMTRLRGESLAELLGRRLENGGTEAPSTARLLRIFLQVAYSIAFAHDRGVLHRDLKPANVMIGEFGDVRLVDWGIAKLLDATEGDEPDDSRVELCGDFDKTAEGEIRGTPGYASPEQLRDSSLVDERSDIYSLGVMLYEMLAGRLPVDGKTPLSVIGDTLAGRLVPLSRRVPVSKRLAAIAHKALAFEPKDRYENAMDVVDDVEAFIEGRPVAAYDEGALHRLGRWYFGRSPRVARLRNVDIDTLCWGTFLGGLATGLGAAAYLAHTSVWAVLFGVAALLLCIPAAFTLLRQPRSDDPGVVIPFSQIEKNSIEQLHSRSGQRTKSS